MKLTLAEEEQEVLDQATSEWKAFIVSKTGGRKSQKEESGIVRGCLIKFENVGPSTMREDVKDIFNSLEINDGDTILKPSVKWIIFDSQLPEFGYIVFNSSIAKRVVDYSIEHPITIKGSEIKLTLIEGGEESKIWKDHGYKWDRTLLKHNKSNHKSNGSGGRQSGGHKGKNGKIGGKDNKSIKSQPEKTQSEEKIESSSETTTDQQLEKETVPSLKRKAESELNEQEMKVARSKEDVGDVKRSMDIAPAV